jgi:hypothetical protein
MKIIKIIVKPSSRAVPLKVNMIDRLLKLLKKMAGGFLRW